MKSQRWTMIGIGLLVAAGGIALLVAASRLVPMLMRGTMRSMMKQMMDGGCGCDSEMCKKMMAEFQSAKD